MDIAPFKDFFFSLSQITRLNIEVWNAKGFLFSSTPDQPRPPNTEKIKDLSARIMSQGTPQKAPPHTRDAMCGVPLKSEEKIIGSLIAYSSNSDKSRESKNNPAVSSSRTKEMHAFLTRVAGLMEERWASQLESQEMAEELTQHFEDLYLYSRVATQIKTLRFSNAMLRDLIEELLETMRADFAFSKLPGREEYNALISTEEIPGQTAQLNSFVETLINGIPQESDSLKENYFIINDSREHPAFGKLHQKPYRFLTVTIKHNENFYGWLGLLSFNLREIFRRSELRLLISIAEQVAVVIANTDLYQDLERFVFNVVKSLVFAIEAKDEYTRGHSERVSRYCMRIAERLQLAEDQRNYLHWASILHDVGKIGIPESILTKPDRLTDEEYSIIKDHPEKGYTILRPLDQLANSLPSILHHHERLDGKGYPRGLRGKEIPLLARIIAVADTFDAITSDRAYRPARTPEQALGVLKQVAGDQLDPALVDVFTELFAEDGVIGGSGSGTQ